MNAPSSRRRKLALAAGASLLLTLAYLYVATRPLADPRLVVAPNGIELIPRSRFGQKAMFDFAWFGSRLQHPVPQAMPSRWSDDPLASGVLVSKDPGVQSLMLYTSTTPWTGRDGRREVIAASLLPIGVDSYINLPYVFGGQAQTFEVEAEGLGRLEIELPGLGWTPAPAPPYRVSLGTGEVVFTRKRWTGPWFAAEFELVARDLPEDTLIFGRSVLSDVDTSAPTRFHIRPGSSSKVFTNRPDEQFELLHVEPNVETVVVQASSTGAKRCTVSNAKGRLIAVGFHSSRGFSLGLHNHGRQKGDIVGLQLEEGWIGPNYLYHDPDNSDVRWEGVLPSLKAGSRKATLFRVVSREIVTLKDLLPEVPLPAHARK